MSTSTVFSNMSVSDAIDAFATDDAFALSVTESYGSAEKGDKARIRTFVAKVYDAAVSALLAEKLDASAVVRIKAVRDGLVTVSEKTPVDLSAHLGTLVANHLEAAFRIMSGECDFSNVPDDADKPSFVDATDLRDLVVTTAKKAGWNVSDFDAETVNRLTTVRIGRKARENDVPDLVHEAFETVPNGTFLKVSDIRRAIAQRHPNLGVSGEWDGRISAALFANNDGKGVEGIISVGGPNKVNPDIHDKMGRNGAIRDFS